MQKIEVSVGAFTLDSSNGFLAKIVSTIAKNHKKTLTASWTSLFKKKKKTSLPSIELFSVRALVRISWSTNSI